MKKILIIALGVLFMCTPLFSQETNYRSKGYKGSVSYTNTLLIWNGLDTSHGYMFNEHHYLGVGGGFYMVPDFTTNPAIVHAYLDYHAYWFDKRSTPLAGIKLGYARSIHPADSYLSAMEIEPNIGWSWGLKSGKGLTLTLGAKILTVPVNFTENSSLPMSVLPSLAFAFEF